MAGVDDIFAALDKRSSGLDDIFAPLDKRSFLKRTVDDVAGILSSAKQDYTDFVSRGDELATANPLALSGTPMNQVQQTPEQQKQLQDYQTTADTFVNNDVKPVAYLLGLVNPMIAAPFIASDARQTYEAGGGGLSGIGKVARDFTYGGAVDFLNQPDLARQFHDNPISTVANGAMSVLPLLMMGKSGYDVAKGGYDRIQATKLKKTADFENFVNAIKDQESGGNYEAANTRSGASGAFQIMPENWSEWAEEAGLSPDAPMTPENQEIVARHKLREYYNKYGPEGAAKAWYGGEDSLNYSDEALNRKQGNDDEPSINEYATDVMNRMGGEHDEHIARQQPQEPLVTPEELTKVYDSFDDSEKTIADILKFHNTALEDLEKETLAARENDINNYADVLWRQIKQPGLETIMENESGDKFTRTYSQNYQWFKELADEYGYKNANKLPKYILEEAIPRIAEEHLQNGYIDPKYGPMVSDAMVEQYNALGGVLDAIQGIRDKVQTIQESDAIKPGVVANNSVNQVASKAEAGDNREYFRVAATKLAKSAAEKTIDGAGRTIKYPGVKESNPLDIASETGFGKFYDAALKVLSPESRSEHARLSAEALRAYKGAMDRATNVTFAKLGGMSKDFAKQSSVAMKALRGMSQDEVQKMVNDIRHGIMTDDTKLKPAYDALDFIHRIETGEGQRTPAQQQLADAIRKEMDSRREKIQEHGALQKAIEDYFPHVWENGKNLFAMLNSKRPMEGSRSFTKKRSIEETLQGIEQGYIPKSMNPVDLVNIKAREMDKWIMAHDFMNEMKERGLAKYYSVFDHNTPEGWGKINDRLGTVYGAPNVLIKEAYDKALMGSLNQVAENIGVTHERGTQLGEGTPAGTWGKSEQGGNKVSTKFGGPESILAHEIGHQIDYKYGLYDHLTKDNPVIMRELRNLADARDEDLTDKEYNEYLQKPAEQMGAVVQAWVHAPELLKEIAPNTYSAFKIFLSGIDELAPLKNIQRSLILEENEARQSVGGMVTRGHYYMPLNPVDVINNYTSTGLRGNVIYDTVRTAENALTLAQLAASAFHAGFTTMEATVSKAALGVEKMSQGNIAGGLKDVATAATPGAAPIENIARGVKLLEAYYDPIKHPEMQPIAKMMELAGARPSMDPFYSLDQAAKVRAAWEKGGLSGYAEGAARVPLAAVQKLAAPIMEWLVPRQKLGVFADLCANELKRNPNMTEDEMRHAASRAWDSVDNRLGQMIYDNKFMSKTAKDLAFLAVRSVGWNAGTVGELGGSLVDLATTKARMERGEHWMSHRMAYAVALPVIAGLYGAYTTYLMTGHGPQSMLDYFYPPTGELDEHGRPQRVSLPTYIKDLYHYWHAPGETVLNKLNPLWSLGSELYRNKDFYGVKIYNEDDPTYQKGLDILAHVAESFVPFAIQGAKRQYDLGASAGKIAAPFIGITPAPGDINKTDAENLAQAYLNDKPKGTRTQEQFDKSQLEQKLIRDMTLNGGQVTQSVNDAVAAGAIAKNDVKRLQNESKETPLQREFKGLNEKEAVNVYNNGNPSEKEQLRKPLLIKLQNYVKNNPQGGDMYKPLIEQLKGGQK